LSTKEWEVIRTCYCHHIDQEVALEAQVVYPIDFLPDQSPRLLAHRCSQGASCNLDGRPSCLWAGTNPVIDPFIETL
jgi:hypothetical protein